MHPIIVWIRRDIRVHDHAALFHASRQQTAVVPLFILDTDLLRTLPSDGATFNFQAGALREMQHSLKALGVSLLLRNGKVMDVHRRLIQELHPAALYFNRDYEPSARERDARVTSLYRSRGIEVKTFTDCVLHEPGEVLTNDGRPFVVFGPFARAWKQLPVPDPLGKPSALSSPRIASESILGAAELKRKVLVTEPAFAGGEGEAKKRWKAFLKDRIAEYQPSRDLPAINGTSRMSAYLRFGCISVRQMVADCSSLARTHSSRTRLSVEKFVDELIWREFYQAVLFHFPRLLRTNYRQEFDRMPWTFHEGHYNAWREGRTGFPLVDAGMRELNRTGWMHNRVRMVVASFLTKDLQHDWKLGERVFEEKLMDIETASNNGGWQWSASTGVDPRPLRVFNPRRQSERFDSEGVYIRRNVPELARVPTEYIHAPHTMPPLLQAQVGCRIGKDYPLPIVDHAEASLRYKQAFARTKGKD